MNLDQAIREVERLKEENQHLREYFTFEPRQAVQQGDAFWVRLDTYELANLLALLEAVRRPDSPLGIAHNGDWVCQILFKLPKVGHQPNATPEGLIEAAKRWGR